MSMATSSASEKQRDGVAWPVQIAGWCCGLAMCVVAMLGLVAEWDPGLATAQLLWLAATPVAVMVSRSRRAKPIPRTETPTSSPRNLAIDWMLALLCAGVSFAVSSMIATRIGDLPPAYHDEYSYLFQAKTLLAGRFSFPSSPVHPELFDQMHVLNEGRMACRYYPGTGLWLAPFVALGHAYWGPQWAGAVATLLLFWTGRELGGRFVGTIAALTMALSPGVGLFGNMLLAHHPTLVGLGLFLLGITRLGRTRSGWDAALAGIGLSFAMLCRPMTAAGIGLPFGIEVVWWLLRGDWQSQTPTRSVSKDESTLDSPTSSLSLNTSSVKPDLLTLRVGVEIGSRLTKGSRRMSVLLGLGLPLIAGWCVMLAYNRDITGEWFTSPYQLYTDTYTPRHVFGFNNVVRGEQHLGPKVIEHYDRWAENLTPSLAASNAFTRGIASWLWTLDVLPLLFTMIVIASVMKHLDRRWRLVAASILSLHAVHVPYWYVGIMGWHYVFETAPLWCLLLAAATQRLFAEWTHSRRNGLKLWWLGLLALSLAGNYVAPTGGWKPRLFRGMNALAHPRRQQSETRRWIEATVKDRPALVLVDQSETEASHLDFVTNDPGLASDILLGRMPPRETDLSALARDFPNRSVFVINPNRKSIRAVEPSHQPP